MLRVLFMIICHAMPAWLVAQNTLKLTTGSSLYIGPAGVLTLDNTNLDMDGTISTAPGNAAIRLTGNATTSIIGTNAPPTFDVLQIEKTGGAQVQLQRNINVRTAINLTSGLLDLNGNNIFLITNAVLIGESSTSHITGTSGYIEGSQILSAPAAQSPGNLGAVISSSQNLGLVIVRRGHQSQTNAAGSGNSILRYYDISLANNTGLDATLRFRYLDEELNSLSENGLVLWKSVNSGNTWSNEGFTSRDVGVNYVEKTGIPSFSRWTLSSPGNPLPVEFTFFNTRCENGKVLITWRTGQEFNNSHFNVERSSNGSNWTVIGNIPAAGNSVTERTYQYIDNSPQADGWYRIAQHDLDGNYKYSIIVHSSCDGAEYMKLWPNPAGSMAWINITTPAATAVNIRLYDNKGAIVHTQKANLPTGNNQLPVSLHRLSNGFYIVVVEFMNGKTRIFKLVKN
jgi:hypothetical protein